jgi:hypothetical protein
MDMNMLEFAQITGGVYENLVQRHSFVAMFRTLACFAYPCYVAATLRRGTMKHRTTGTFEALRNRRFEYSQLSSRVLCEKTGNGNMSVA